MASVNLMSAAYSSGFASAAFGFFSPKSPYVAGSADDADYRAGVRSAVAQMANLQLNVA